MSNLTFAQLVDIEQIRHLLEAQYKITGILSAILDTDENVLVAVGWQDICTRFHRSHPAACVRCRESDAYIKSHLHNFDGEYLDYRCKNGLRDVAVPIIIGGEHLATLFTGQFFYDDDKPDVEFFRAQAREFGFNEADYLAALNRVPVCTREQVCNIMGYYRNLVKMLADLGLKNLELTREVKERKRAEKALQESRDYLDKIINSITDPIFVKDREHRLVMVNDAECALTGRSREELIGRTDYDFFPKEEVDVFWEKDELVFETELENINEEEITNAQGDKRAIVTKKTLYKDAGGNKYIVGIVRDITELKQTEQALLTLNEELENRVAARTAELVAANELLRREVGERKQTEQQLALMNFAMNHMLDGAYLCDEHAGFRYVNEEACRALGYSRDELLGLKVFDIDPDFQIEHWPDLWQRLKTDGSIMIETRHRTRDGRIFPVEIKSTYVEYEGHVYGMALARDITERKRVEEELQREKDLINRITETSPIGILVFNPRGRVTFANQKAKDILGITEENTHRLSYDAAEWRITDFDEIPMADEELPFQQVLNARRPVYNVLHTIQRSDRRRVFLSVSGAPLFDYSGQIDGIVLAFEDVTDRKKAEEELKNRQRQLEELNRTLEHRVQEEVAKNREKDIILIQQNRQAALGEALEHIAHQWKQPLSTISLMSQDLGETCSCGELTDEFVHETVGKTLALVEHMAQTIDVFRDFYKPEKEKAVFRIKDSINKALSFIEPALRFYAVKVELDADPDLLAIGYPKEYAQVLLIILTNARDAFKGREVEKARVEIQAFAEGTRAVVTVTDNAGGIPDAVIDKIFNPYFTTKESSGGTGIGLYMSKNIIEKNMGGTLTALNVGLGAQFRIEIDMPGKLPTEKQLCALTR